MPDSEKFSTNFSKLHRTGGTPGLQGGLHSRSKGIYHPERKGRLVLPFHETMHGPVP